jgi:hypothetical protein
VRDWTWDKYTIPVKRGKLSAKLSLLTDLRDKQTVAAKETNKIRREKTLERIEYGLNKCISKGIKPTQKNTAKESGLTDRTLRKYKDYWLSKKNSLGQKSGTTVYIR